MVCIGGAGQDHFCLPQQWIQPYPTYDIYCAAIHWQIHAETFLSTMTWYKFSSLCHFVAVKWTSYTIVTWENVIFLWYFCGCQPTFSARLNWSHEVLKFTNIECVSVESWQKSSVYFDCKLLCHYGRVVILSNPQVQEVVLIRVIELCVYRKLKWDLVKSLDLVNETLTVSIIESMKFWSMFTLCGGCKHMSFLMIPKVLTYCDGWIEQWHVLTIPWWDNDIFMCNFQGVTDYFPLLCFSLTSYERRQVNIVYDHYWQ
jgi:hypothetical protein